MNYALRFKFFLFSVESLWQLARVTISNLPRIWCHIFTECVVNGTSFRCANERKEVPNHPPLISMTLTSLVYSPRALLTDPEFSFSTTQPSKDKDTLSINHHLRIHYQNLCPSLPQAISRKMFCFTEVALSYLQMCACLHKLLLCWQMKRDHTETNLLTCHVQADADFLRTCQCVKVTGEKSVL